MTKHELYADFNNADPAGRVRLNCAGTADDLARLDVRLRDGLAVVVYDDELEADGEVRFSPEERVWVAAVDWRMVRRRLVKPAAHAS